jgi:hypothetical protein
VEALHFNRGIAVGVNISMKFFKKLIDILTLKGWRERRVIKKRLEELRKRDPFIY